MSNKENFPFIESNTTRIIREQVFRFYQKIENEVRIKLSDKGFVFDTNDAFYSFCEERVSCIQFGDHIKELRLDYTDQSKGVLLVRWSDEIKFNTGYENNIS